MHTEGLNVISRSRNQASLAHQGWQGVGWPYLSPDLNPKQHRDLEFGAMKPTYLQRVRDAVVRIQAEISQITPVKGEGSPAGNLRPDLTVESKRNSIKAAEVKKGQVKRAPPNGQQL